jgi:hypothetical protein
MLSGYITIRWAKKSSPSVNSLNLILRRFKELILTNQYNELSEKRRIFNGVRLNFYVDEFVNIFKSKENSIVDYENMLNKKQKNLFNELQKFVRNIVMH